MALDKLVLVELKTFYKALQPRLVKPWDFLLYGLLVWLQEKLIEYKTTAAVDDAIRRFEEAEVKEPPLTEGVYSETGSGFFDEMRMTARYVTTEQQDKP